MKFKFKRLIIISFFTSLFLLSFLFFGCKNYQNIHAKDEKIEKKYSKNNYINTKEKLEVQKIRESLLRSSYYFEKFANAESDFFNFFNTKKSLKTIRQDNNKDNNKDNNSIDSGSPILTDISILQKNEAEKWIKEVSEHSSLLNDKQFILDSQENRLLIDNKVQNMLWAAAKKFFDDKNFKKRFFVISLNEYKKILFFEYDIFEKDYSFLKFVLRKETLFYENAPEFIKNKKENVVHYLSSQKSDFNKIPENFKLVPDLVLLALRNKKIVPKNIIQNFKENNEIMKEAFINQIIKYKDLNQYLKKDKNICIQAIEESIESWNLIPEDLKRDDDIAYLYIIKSKGNIEWVDTNFFKNQDLLKKIIIQMPWIFYKIPSQYQNNPEIIKLIINFLEYNFLPKEAKHNVEIIIHFINNGKFGNNYSKLPKNIKSNYALIKTIIKNNPEEYKNIPKDLLEDSEIVKNLIYINPEIIKFLPSKYQNDKELMLMSININPNVFKYISDDLKRDRNFFKLAFLKNPKNIKYMPEDMIYKKVFFLSMFGTMMHY